MTKPYTDIILWMYRKMRYSQKKKLFRLVETWNNIITYCIFLNSLQMIHLTCLIQANIRWPWLFSSLHPITKDLEPQFAEMDKHYTPHGWPSTCKVWAEIMYTFPNFNCAAVEVWEWIFIFDPHFTVYVITYSCRIKSVHVCKRWPWLRMIWHTKIVYVLNKAILSRL